MEYTIRFRLDLKKSVYVSKKAVTTEPYYQISAIIRINRNKEIHYFTGYSAQKSAWFSNRNEAKQGDKNRTFGIHKNCSAKKRQRIVQYSEVNRTLDLICAKLLTLSNQVKDISKEELINILNQEVGKIKQQSELPQSTIENPKAKTEDQTKTFWKLAELFYMDPLVSEGRNKTRRNAINHLQNFEAYRKTRITFAQCDAKFLIEFQCYLNQDEGQLNRNNNSMHRVRKKNINTISKIMTVTKHFFRWCRLRHGICEYGNIIDYQVPTPKYGDPITITQKEKQQLLNTPFEDPTLNYIRDLFYFQCSIGCRVSDFFQLKYENLLDENGVLCIRYLPKKTKNVTGIACRIPLSPQAIHIWERYKRTDATPKTPLFDFPPNRQEYNYNLKKIFKAARLDRTVTVYNAYGEEEYKPLYELAKSKFARSCFIDILVGKGVTDNIIATMSGHKAGSNAFHRYHNSQKDEQQNKAVQLLD